MKRLLLAVGLATVLVAGPSPASATGDGHAAAREPSPHPRNVRVAGPDDLGLVSVLNTAAVVSNGTLRLGVNPEGHLNVWSAGRGLQFVPTGADALIPGCLCEGWGVADTISRTSGFASVDNGGVSGNLSVQSFLSTGDSATSVVEIGNRLRVRHFYHPSADPHLYRVDVRVENVGTTTANVVYRRAMDWDVPPTIFDEFVTVQGATPYLLDATNDGFTWLDPLFRLSDLGERGSFVDAGPYDHGAAFDLALGSVAPGGSAEITLFYGAAADEGTALAALDSVRAQIHSLGQPNTTDGARLGTPNTFMFGVRGTCEGDNDCDHLANADEAALGTNPNDPDTDGDGLLDPWEAPPSTPGAGFHGPGFELYQPTRDDVFGPFNPGFCPLPASDGRLGAQVACFNDPPDPVKKDVFLELDWQDCRFGECPEFLGLDVDPLHHAPSLPALGRVSTMFRDAPVSSPSGGFGVNLHVLIDEAIPHEPNCDQGEAFARPASFGTPTQRTHARRAEILAAKEKAVRYVWSGHSSRSDSGAACPNPGSASFLFQGLGISELADYDWSPFGDADVGGRDVLVTLGPVWSCSAEIKLNESSPFLGPCYRQIKVVQTWGPFGGHSVVPIPGIFPAKIRDHLGNQREIRWPINQMLGVGESAGIAQLWARGLSHLLGHALGIAGEATVGNRPDVAHAPNPESYGSWEGLSYAPSAGTRRLQEAFPDYATLAAADSDGDGVPEGEDNCAGIPNPPQNGRQPDRDFDGFGDACDFDLDGDGLGNRSSGSFTALASAQAAVAAAGVEPAEDPFPFDTDNDGVPNDVDTDDDGDGVPDTADGCPVVPDPGQADRDGDGLGDACDLDDDGDSYPDAVETLSGSDPLDPASTPERLGLPGVCSDGVDNDRDGLVDGADGGCRDTDGDTMPDDVDNCPTVANRVGHWADGDGDGLGDACDPTVDGASVAIVAVTDAEVGPSDAGTTVAWEANRRGAFHVLLGGGDCTEGAQLDAGRYEPPAALAVTIPAALLAEGPNVVRACLTTAAGTFSAAATVVRESGGAFPFEGFFAPVKNPPVLNALKAGAAVPVKFSLGGNRGLDVLAPGSPSSHPIACATGVGADPVAETVSAGASSLTYDAETGQYVYVWKTERQWAGTCRRFVLTLADGSSHEALFTLTR